MHNIIMGFPAVGKTTSVKRAVQPKDFIDLKSSNFIINGVKSDDWYKIYCNIAIDLAEDHDVFISALPEVLNYMRIQDQNIRDSIIIIYPVLSLKDEWLKRMKDRYENSHLNEDKKSYEYISDHYDEIVKDIQNDNSFLKIRLENINYPLLCGIINLQKRLNTTNRKVHLN